MKKEVIKSYDKESGKYAPLMFKEKGFYETNKPLLNLLKKQKKKRILDVGCGPGLNSIYLSRKGFDVTGLDFSSGMIREARKNAKKSGLKIKFIHADMNNYKYKKKFGAVLAAASLHNMKLKNLKKSLETLVNILDSGGVLAIIMRHGKFEGIKIRNNIKRYYRYSNPNEIKKLLKGKGLSWKKTYYASSNSVPYFTILFVKK